MKNERKTTLLCVLIGILNNLDMSMVATICGRCLAFIPVQQNAFPSNRIAKWNGKIAKIFIMFNLQ